MIEKHQNFQINWFKNFLRISSRIFKMQNFIQNFWCNFARYEFKLSDKNNTAKAFKGLTYKAYAIKNKFNKIYNKNITSVFLKFNVCYLIFSLYLSSNIMAIFFFWENCDSFNLCLYIYHWNSIFGFTGYVYPLVTKL